jgi:c-di-GMP-related signal transduction protein
MRRNGAVTDSSSRRSAAANSERFLGRQAIFDSNDKLYGYELLFRSSRENVFSGESEDATNQTIDSCLSMVACSSADNLFLNCTRNALVSMSVKLLPSERVVLEVLETVAVDEELINACKELRRYGFRLALDDFAADETKVDLVDLADYVKVDFRASDAAARQKIYELFHDRKPIFLAEKVETLEQVTIAKEEGHTLFQGYYHARPEIISETQITPDKSVYLELFSLLAESPLDFQKTERLLMTEPSLCYRLLRLANSAVYGFRHRISSIQAALNAVGEDAFRRLVTLVLANRLSRSANDRDIEQALERAFFCESMAPLLNERPAELYMLGMLSMMDRMLNIPMKQLVELIPVDERIQEALLGSGGGMGRALEVCLYEEHGGDSQGLPHPDVAIGNSAPYYFLALIAAGNALQRARIRR